MKPEILVIDAATSLRRVLEDNPRKADFRTVVGSFHKMEKVFDVIRKVSDCKTATSSVPGAPRKALGELRSGSCDPEPA